MRCGDFALAVGAAEPRGGRWRRRRGARSAPKRAVNPRIGRSWRAKCAGGGGAHEPAPGPQGRTGRISAQPAGQPVSAQGTGPYSERTRSCLPSTHGL